jgi:hypothetical protein
MEGRKSFLLRIDAELLEAIRRWADEELRSLNGQIEYVLRRALRESGRANPSRKTQAPQEEPAPPADVE